MFKLRMIYCVIGVVLCLAASLVPKPAYSQQKYPSLVRIQNSAVAAQSCAEDEIPNLKNVPFLPDPRILAQEEDQFVELYFPILAARRCMPKSEVENRIGILSNDGDVLLPRAAGDTVTMQYGDLNYTVIEGVPINPEYTPDEWLAFIDGAVASGHIIGMWDMDAWVKEVMSDDPAIAQLALEQFGDDLPIAFITQNLWLEVFYRYYLQGNLDEGPALTIDDLIFRAPSIWSSPMSASMACHRIRDFMRVLPYTVLGLFPAVEYSNEYGRVYRLWAMINIKYTAQALERCNDPVEQRNLFSLRFLDQRLVYKSISGLDRENIDKLVDNQNLGFVKQVALDTYPKLSRNPEFGNGQMTMIVIGAVILIVVVVAASGGSAGGAFLIAVGA